MKKITTTFLIILTILITVILSILIKDKDLVNKITIFLSAILALLISYLTGITKRKNGLITGLIIGISIASISLIIHYIFARTLFDFLYLRSSIIILSSVSGCVFGVNKNIV